MEGKEKMSYLEVQKRKSENESENHRICPEWLSPFSKQVLLKKENIIITLTNSQIWQQLKNVNGMNEWIDIKK